MNTTLYPPQRETGAARPADVWEIAALLARHYAKDGAPKDDGRDVSPALPEAYVTDLLTEPTAVVRVARQEGRVVGCLLGECKPAEAGDHRAIVGHVATGPGAHTQTVLWLLYDAADEFYHRGVEEVWIATQGHNSRRRTLSALGFTAMDTDAETGTTIWAARVSSVLMGLMRLVFRIPATPKADQSRAAA